MQKRFPQLFLALVCVRARDICCFPYVEFERFLNQRRKAKGEKEMEYVIEVSVRPRKQFRVWISPPQRKGRWLAEAVIPRNDFPAKIFTR